MKIKRQRDELLEVAELIITENIPIINAGEESNGVARLDKVVEKIKREQLNKRNIDYGNKVQRIKLLRENLFVLKDDCKIDYKNGKKTLRGRC